MRVYCHVQVDGVSYFPSPQLQKEPRQLAHADSSAFKELVMLEESHSEKEGKRVRHRLQQALGSVKLRLLPKELETSRYCYQHFQLFLIIKVQTFTIDLQ